MINKNSLLAQRFFEYGKLDDCPIYDMHAHMHEMTGGGLPDPSPQAMAAMMKKAGTRITLFCSHYALFNPETGEKANIDPVHLFPECFRAYHAVISRYTDPEAFFRRMENNPDVYVGAKFLCDYYSVPLTDERHRPYFEYLNTNKLLALIHTWGTSSFDGPDQVAEIAGKYPDVTLICGHCFHGKWEEGISLAKAYPNIYYEITALHDDRGILERLCEGVGSERILFGTDLPWFSTYTGMGAVLAADITDEDRRNIFYRNAEILLKRFNIKA
jgi:hypothetical protein